MLPLPVSVIVSVPPASFTVSPVPLINSTWSPEVALIETLLALTVAPAWLVGMVTEYVTTGAAVAVQMCLVVE